MGGMGKSGGNQPQDDGRNAGESGPTNFTGAGGGTSRDSKSTDGRIHGPDHFLSAPLTMFYQLSCRIYRGVSEAVRNGASIEAVINRENVPVYLKSVDKRILAFNDVYKRTFTPDALPLGKFGESFLHETVIPISQASDRMIMTGATALIFDHYGNDADGDAMLFRTAKFNLIGRNRSTFAVLGITKIEKRIETKGRDLSRNALLARQFELLQGLSTEDRQLAISIGQGKTPVEISSNLDVSRRTFETRRTDLLKAMQVDTPLELVKLLVRLDERGYADLNL